MFIIVEGPDGAGKSTLVEALDRALWKRGRGCVLVNHKAAPRRPALSEYARDLAFYRPGGDVDLVLDRCWLSEEVYGPLWRGTRLPDYVKHYLNLWAESRGALFVVLDASDEVLVERVCGTRGDDLVTDPDEVRLLGQTYRESFHQSDGREAVVRHVWPYDLDDVVAGIVDRATSRGGVASPLDTFPGYLGPARPAVLFLGDERSESVREQGYLTAFPPLPGSAAQQVLWPALVSGANASSLPFGVANGWELDVDALHKALGRPSIVALGRQAAQACARYDVLPAAVVPHPQYVKRFFWPRRAEYDALLWALQGDHSGHFGPADPSHPAYQRETRCN